MLTAYFIFDTLVFITIGNNMKISYKEKRQVNLGNFELKAVEIAVEDSVKFENETVSLCFDRLKSVVVEQLEKSLNEKGKPITVTTKKKKVEEIDREMVAENIIEKLIGGKVEIKEQPKPEQEKIMTKEYSEDDTRNMFVAIGKHDRNYANNIKAEVARLKISNLSSCNQDQLKHLNIFAINLLKENGLVYDKQQDLVVKIENEDSEDDMWDKL